MSIQRNHPPRTYLKGRSSLEERWEFWNLGFVYNYPKSRYIRRMHVLYLRVNAEFFHSQRRQFQQWLHLAFETCSIFSFFASCRIEISMTADCEMPSCFEISSSRRFASWDIRRLVCRLLFIKALYHNTLYKQAPKYKRSNPADTLRGG